MAAEAGVSAAGQASRVGVRARDPRMAGLESCEGGPRAGGSGARGARRGEERRAHRARGAG